MKRSLKTNIIRFKLLCGLMYWCHATVSAQLIIPIETANTSLVLQADTADILRIMYFGEKLANEGEYGLISDEYRQAVDYSGILNAAYTPAGGRNLVEPAITVTHADGNKSLDLRYVDSKTEKLKDNVSLITIMLKDPVYQFQVKLFYKVFFDEDVIEQWSSIRHTESGSVVLHKYASANLYMISESYWLNQYFGDWAREMQAEEVKLSHGIKTIDSKLGTRTNLFQHPVFMVSLGEPSSEDEGTVLLANMEWSGNFKIDFEIDHLNSLRIIAGINNYASDYTLEPTKELITPKLLYTLSTEGKGKASRNLHTWARKYKLHDGEGTRLTLLNNWESTYFDFNQDKLGKLIHDTKKIGVDLFLLDDGWFGNKYPRNGDTAGLGDWDENREKLPDGLGYLIKESTKNDVKFGIWIEPEMVNPKSELYENHPDWVVKQPNRDEYYFRNQLVLDLSNPEVQNFVYGVVDDLLAENPQLAYIKWDCNAVVYNAYSATNENQSHFFVDYVYGLYDVLKRIREKYPDIPMMLCSGGGGRVDYAALEFFSEYWPSDNTDPLERIFIQWEYSYFYPAIASSNHVTDWGKQSLKFRTDVAMMGKLGFDIVISKLEPKDLSFVQTAVENYNSFKDIIWYGDQYRLSNPNEVAVASMMYIDSDRCRSVIFNYLINKRYDSRSSLPIKLKGLDPTAKYRIKETNSHPDQQSSFEPKVYSGEFLMKVGVNPLVNASRESVILLVEAI